MRASAADWVAAAGLTRGVAPAADVAVMRGMNKLHKRMRSFFDGSRWAAEGYGQQARKKKRVWDA